MALHEMPCSECPSHCLAESAERLSGTTEMCIDAYGLRIGVRTNAAAALERLSHHLPVGWHPVSASAVERWYTLHVVYVGNPNPAPRYVLHQGPHNLAETGDLTEALTRLEFDIKLYVVEGAPTYVFVHAGVVGWQGRAILIPGQSYSGKSTLVAALCHAGATYYSDEYALLDVQGRVHPYPRALRLRPDVKGVPVLHGQHLTHLTGHEPLRVGLVVLTEYEPGAGWQPRTLSPGQGLLKLLANTMSAQRRPQVVLATLQQVFGPAQIVQSVRGEAGEIAEHLLRLVARAETGGPETPGRQKSKSPEIC